MNWYVAPEGSDRTTGVICNGGSATPGLDAAICGSFQLLMLPWKIPAIVDHHGANGSGLRGDGRLGTAKVSSKGVFTRRFRLTKTGWYRLRFKYAGSATVAGGTIYDVVRIRRHRL